MGIRLYCPFHKTVKTIFTDLQFFYILLTVSFSYSFLHIIYNVSHCKFTYNMKAKIHIKNFQPDIIAIFA